MTFLDPYAARMLAVLRIVAGLLFFHIGMAKILHFPMLPMLANITPGDWPEGPAGMIEMVFGFLVMIGFYGRVAAFICSGEMAFAYFIAHFPKSMFPVVNGGATAILYSFVFLYLAAAGPGPWSINKK